VTQRFTWVGYLGECVTPWPVGAGETCTRWNPLTGQHMCIDSSDETHDAAAHTCRCGVRQTIPRVRPRTRRQRRAARDALYPADTPGDVPQS
jgi:hypothetical protein